MATYSRGFFTGSTSGLPIAVTSTDSAGAAVIHTSSTKTEEIYMDVYNQHTAAVELGIDFGSTTRPVKVSIPPKSGPMTVIPGWPLRNGLTISCFCSTVSTAALFVVGKTAVIESTVHV